MERPPPVTHRIYKTTNLLTKKNDYNENNDFKN